MLIYGPHDRNFDINTSIPNDGLVFNQISKLVTLRGRGGRKFDSVPRNHSVTRNNRRILLRGWVARRSKIIDRKSGRTKISLTRITYIPEFVRVAFEIGGVRCGSRSGVETPDATLKPVISEDDTRRRFSHACTYMLMSRFLPLRWNAPEICFEMTHDSRLSGTWCSYLVNYETDFPSNELKLDEASFSTFSL